MLRRICAFLLLGTLAGLSSTASAQFAGDIFFPSPSVVVQEGGTVQVELHAFSGAGVFGAAHVNLRYDPTQVAIEAIEAPLANDAGLTVTTQLSPGLASFIALNGQSLRQPIGTAVLATVMLKPLVPAGNYVNITSSVERFLRADGSAYTNPQGFALELAVTTPGSAAKLSRSALTFAAQGERESPDAEALRQRAALLARPGAALRLMELDASGSAYAVEVKTADPEAAVD